MGRLEYAVNVREGDTTTAHRVVVSDGVADALAGVADDEPRLVHESIAVFLEHEKSTTLPDDVTLDWIADTVAGYFDEIRARLG